MTDTTSPAPKKNYGVPSFLNILDLCVGCKNFTNLIYLDQISETEQRYVCEDCDTINVRPAWVKADKRSEADFVGPIV